jgi:hypothetical protein
MDFEQRFTALTPYFFRLAFWYFFTPLPTLRAVGEIFVKVSPFVVVYNIPVVENNFVVREQTAVNHLSSYEVTKCPLALHERKYLCLTSIRHGDTLQRLGFKDVFKRFLRLLALPPVFLFQFGGREMHKREILYQFPG